MRLLTLAAISLLAAHTAAYAQPQLMPRDVTPLTIHFVNSKLDDAMTFLAKQAGIDIQWDETVKPDRRNAKVTLRLEKATLAEVLEALTSRIGLSYRVVDAQTIRIYRQP